MDRKPGKVWIKTSGGVPEIVGVIADVDKSLNGDTRELAGEFERSKAGLKKAFEYVVNNIKYKRDGETEVVKYPQKTLREKTGDCKSMSILIGSILKDKNIPYKYRFTYTDKNNPLAWHVYPIATIGGKDIIMDAVVKEFNREHPYVKKYDYSPKSIAAISGVGATANIIIPPKNYIDTFTYTGGEITAVLLYEQLNIISAFYPSAQIEADKAQIKDALYKGVNSTQGLNIIRQINDAEIRTALVRANKDKTSQFKARTNVGINNPLIPLSDCTTQLTPEFFDLCEQNGISRETCAQLYTPTFYAECEKANRVKRMLNEYLEESAHHLLYEYEDRPNAAPQTVATKKVLHVGAIDALSEITGVSRNNLRLWLRNGVLRRNALKGAGPLQPEATIPALKQAVDQGIGVLPVAVIVAIISAIAAAVAGTLQLIGQMQQTEQARIYSAAQTIGQPNFGPLKSDWETYQQFVSQGGEGTQDESTNWLPFAAAAAGAYFILK